MTSIAQFNPDDNRQVASCAAGQACLLYTWKKSSTEIGSYRECFSTSIQLGHSSLPVNPLPSCSLSRTQADSRSSIRACVCTQDFCNIVPDGQLLDDTQEDEREQNNNQILLVSQTGNHLVYKC